MLEPLADRDPGDEAPTCIVCGKPIPATASRYGPADRFDTSRCARSFHGTSLAVDVPAERIASSLAGRRLKL